MRKNNVEMNETMMEQVNGGTIEEIEEVENTVKTVVVNSDVYKTLCDYVDGSGSVLQTGLNYIGNTEIYKKASNVVDNIWSGWKKLTSFFD